MHQQRLPLDVRGEVGRILPGPEVLEQTRGEGVQRHTPVRVAQVHWLLECNLQVARVAALPSTCGGGVQDRDWAHSERTRTENENGNENANENDQSPAQAAKRVATAP